MFKLIKAQEKYIKTLEKDGTSSTKISKSKLKIYFMILGYFSFKNDLPFNYKDKEILNEITKKICVIINKEYNFFIASNNHRDSFIIAINRFLNKNIENYLSKDELLEYFDIGYDYANYLIRNSSIIDYLSGNYSRKESKLIKSLYK